MFQHPSELTLISVAEPGVANRERVVIRVLQATNLSSFGLLVGLKLQDGTALPLWDQFYWFGSVTIEPGWLLLYTGPGQFRLTHDVNTKQPIYEFHWNRKTTVFHVDNTVPILFQIGALTIGDNSAAPIKQPPPPPAPSPVSLKSLADLLKPVRQPSEDTQSLERFLEGVNKAAQEPSPNADVFRRFLEDMKKQTPNQAEETDALKRFLEKANKP